METHLITSENDEHSDNDVTSQKPTNETDSAGLIKSAEASPVLLSQVCEPQQQLEVKPSTSAQAELSPSIAKSNDDSRSSRASAKDTKSSSPRVKSKKGMILCMNRLNAFLLHLLVPLSLLICIVLKLSYQSLLYLLMLLILPFFFPVNKQTISKRIRNFLVILIAISSLILVGQLTFQVVLITEGIYDNPAELNCSFAQELLEEIGYSRLDTAYWYDIIRIIVPDVWMLLVSIATLLACQHLSHYNRRMKRLADTTTSSRPGNTTGFTDTFGPLANVEKDPATGKLTTQISHIIIEGFESAASTATELPLETPTRAAKNKKLSRQKSILATGVSPIMKFFKTILPSLLHLMFLGLLFACGSVWPSLLATPYFILYIFFMLKWSIAKRRINHNCKIQKVLKLFLIFYLSAHILVSYLYQFHMFQLYSPPDTLASRLLGLNQIVYTDCTQPAHFFFNMKFKWQQLAYPFVLLTLYWFLAIEFSYTKENNALPIPALPSIAVARVLSADASKTSTTLDEAKEVNDEDPIETNETQTTSDRRDSNFLATLVDGLNNSQNERDGYTRFGDSIDSFSLLDECENTNQRRGNILKHLFHSEENMSKSAFLNIPLNKKKGTSEYSLNNKSKRKSNSMITLNQDRLRIGQLVLNFVFVREYLISCVKFFKKQSYLLSLISMMAWSILYHSVLAFVLLIWACLIWITPDSRKWCLKTSPLFVVYSVALLCLEFVYGLQLTNLELPENKEIGLIRYHIPFGVLAVKASLMLFFWVTLSQYLTERRSVIHGTSQTDETTANADDSSSQSDLAVKKRNDIKKHVINWIQTIFIKYWILLSSIMLLLMSCVSPVVVYRIIYMMLFLYFIITFQIFHSFWRRSLYYFHGTVVLYSMICLLLIYTFQFAYVQAYFQNNLKISDLVLRAIGFEKLRKDELALRLLTPTTFLIVNIIQIHYFNAPWLELTDMEKIEAEPSEMRGMSPKNIIRISRISQTEGDEQRCKEGDEQRRKEEFLPFIIRMFAKITSLYRLVARYAWRIAEIHIYKIVIATIGCYCLVQVSLNNLFFFFLILFSLLVDGFVETKIEKRVHAAFSGLFLVWVCFTTLTSMIYQLEFIKSPLVTNCSNTSGKSIDPYLQEDHDNLVYIGILKSTDIIKSLESNIVIFLMLTVQKIIKMKNKYIRKKRVDTQPIYSTIFDQVTWRDMDKSIVNFFKYQVNFFFYRFGLEICLCMTSIVIIVRMDAYALLYGIWLGFFLRMRRKTVCQMWTVYFVFLLITLLIQYVECLGLPPILCYDYPWSMNKSTSNWNKVRLWLFLPAYENSPNSRILAADFFQVLFVWLQLIVFRIERQNKLTKAATGRDSPIVSMGGNNDEIIYDADMIRENPYHDFVSECRNYLDKFKYGIYMYSYWIVLAILFLTGTTRTSFLCLGYVVLSFFFFWFGTTFLIKPIEKLIKLWNILVFYTFVVIFSKACLQIVICLLTEYLEPADLAILIDLFGVDCRTLPSGSDPVVHNENVDLVWDVFCFIVLILQRRMYMSYMFQFVVYEYKAQSTLAARGAEIFKFIIQSRVKKEKEKEKKEFDRLKSRVNRIKKKRVKQNQTKEKLKSQKKNPTDYYTSVRSGDYYMFESDFDITDSDSSDIDSAAIDVKESEPMARTDSTIDQVLATTSKVEDKKDKKDKRISFNILTLKSVSENERLSKIEILGDTNEDQPQSFLTIEDKTTLKTLGFLKDALNWIIDSVIFVLSRYSKDFRVVSHILDEEKLVLKRQYKNTETPALQDLFDSTLSPSKDTSPVIERPAIDKQTSNLSVSFSSIQPDNAQLVKSASEKIDSNKDNNGKDISRLDNLMSCLFYYLLSQSELFCYFFLIINHLVTATVLSSPLPIAVFLWAMLGVPRPKKSFWISVITYVEAIIVIKYLFAFKIYPWNKQDSTTAEDDLNYVKILGIGGDGNTKFYYDLAVLVVIFLHRNILKTMGLWRNSSADDDELITNEEKLNLRKKEDEIENRVNSPDKYDSDSETDYTESDFDGASKSTVVRRRRRPLRHDMSIEEERLEMVSSIEEKKLAEAEEEDEGESDSDDAIDETNTLDETDRPKTPKKEKLKKMARNMKSQSLLRPFIEFYNDLGTKHYAVVTDCYAKMFMCDFLNCIIIIFTYQYFGSTGNVNEANALSSLKENKVPKEFLYLFLIQFVLMIVDRALYLRKNIHGKFFFQIVLVIVVHFWLFFILPSMTNLPFSKNLPSKIYYLIKCLYFGFSSRQIRCGFPKRILGNFVTKSYNYINLILFKAFLLVPFLLELRALMDWMFTDTSFSLFDWLQMEDIYSNIFVLKCQRYNEKKYITPAGQKRNALIKYGFGGTLLVIIILIIWFPLLLFSFSDTFTRSVPPATFSANIQFSGFLPLYSMNSQQRLFQEFTEQDYIELKKNSPEEAKGFFADFRVQDIYCISIPGASTSLWEMSPPSLNTLKDQLGNTSISLQLDFIYQITRESTEEKEQLSEAVSAIRSIDINNSTKAEIFKLLSGSSQTPILIKSVYPRFGHVRTKGNILEIDVLKLNTSSYEYYSDVLLGLNNKTSQLWWDVYDANQPSKSYKVPCNKDKHLNMVIFSDPASPSSISFITEQGIIGIYITLVLAVSRILRFWVLNSSYRIMFEQLPNVDKILKLLSSIYIVRENKKFKLEEKLFSQLIFLYRSTEVMIKFTRHRDSDLTEKEAKKEKKKKLKHN